MTTKPTLTAAPPCNNSKHITPTEHLKRFHALQNAAPELLGMLKHCLFVLESTAHMQGLEAALLPMCDDYRENLKNLGLDK